MTVQELIKKLEKIKNKESEVCIEDEDRGDFHVIDVEEFDELYTYLKVK